MSAIAGNPIAIRAAAAADVPAMLALMRELAEFEQLTHLFVATEADLADALFGARAGPGAGRARLTRSRVRSTCAMW